ncbi:MAG: hypothetical protein HXS48_14655 [Theionarchaea archaeon]|nr:hypothetical protein [Theionarchaea archaeon]
MKYGLQDYFQNTGDLAYGPTTSTTFDSTGDDFGDYIRIHTQKVPYLLGDNRNMNKEMKDKS